MIKTANSKIAIKKERILSAVLHETGSAPHFVSSVAIVDVLRSIFCAKQKKTAQMPAF
ncbi:hypothetical protein EVA_12375 [gut metagenome]|uniref:Uncharacterized protein n=1 Tax=gut metagenome TaxID=749906 RepID=J9GCJ5_9ZZZZ